MSPTAEPCARRNDSRRAAATARLPGGYAGKLLRVDLTSGTLLGRAVGPDARCARCSAGSGSAR